MFTRVQFAKNRARRHFMGFLLIFAGGIFFKIFYFIQRVSLIEYDAFYTYIGVDLKLLTQKN